MRSLISLSAVFLAALLSSSAHASTLNERVQCNADSCSRAPTSGFPDIPKFQGTPAMPLSRKGLTNAQRLARGLPLNRPVRRATGVFPARRAQVSPTPQITYTGVIQVFSGTTSLGYVAPEPEYYTPQVTSELSLALSVSFQLNVGATSGSQLTLTELNDNRGPILGLVQSGASSVIGVGNFNYLFVDPVSTSTPPGSPPQSDPSYYSAAAAYDAQAETSVWSVDLTTGALTAQWINPDGSTPATVFFVQDSYLLAGGDAAAYQAEYSDPVTTVTLQFVPM